MFWLWSPPMLWLLLGSILLGLALLGIDTDGLLLIGGLTSLLLTVATTLLPLPPFLAAVLFVGVSTAGYGWLRRWSRQQREAALPHSSQADLARVISGFSQSTGTARSGEGRVLWQGQSWAAINLDSSTPLAPGTVVQVMGRDGTRLQVMARDERTD